jgi:hypothetical protein
MACPNYQKLQKECAADRKLLAEFHVKKLPHWQRDSTLMSTVRAKQQAILRAQELMEWHSTNCPECLRYPPDLE